MKFVLAYSILFFVVGFLCSWLTFLTREKYKKAEKERKKEEEEEKNKKPLQQFYWKKGDTIEIFKNAHNLEWAQNYNNSSLKCILEKWDSNTMELKLYNGNTCTCKSSSHHKNVSYEEREQQKSFEEFQQQIDSLNKSKIKEKLNVLLDTNTKTT